jgi:type I restriction enzyme M protein
MGRMVNRTQRELTDDDIARIANTYHAWRGDIGSTALGATTGGATTPAQSAPAPYVDIPGFCRSVTIEEIRQHGYILTPGRYVGAEETETEDELFEKTMTRLVLQLRQQHIEARQLDEAIWQNLKELGYDG